MEPSGVQAIRDAWLLRVQADPGKTWTIPANGGQPVRVKALTTAEKNPDLITMDNDTGTYQLTRNGKTKTIIPFTSFVDVFLAEWDNAPATLNPATWKQQFLDRFVGGTRIDLEFLLREWSLVTSQQASRTQGPLYLQDLAAAIQPERSPYVSIYSASPDFDVGEANTNLVESFPDALEQQKRIFNGEKCRALLKNYEAIIESLAGEGGKRIGGTHISELGAFALHTYGNGRPAVPWTLGGSPELKETADYWLLTEPQYSELVDNGDIYRPVVIRDREFRMRRAGITRDEFLDELLHHAELQIHVQDLSISSKDQAAVSMPIAEAVKKMKRTLDPISNIDAPINLLNIMDKTANICLTPIAKHFNLLRKACYYSTDSKLFDPRAILHVGKDPVEIYTATDLTNCIQFKVLGQRGAASTWHVDNCGVWTHVHLEANTDDPVEEDEDVIKFWPIFPFNLLSDEDRQRSLKDFGTFGSSWMPEPRCKIPFLALVRGDTLVMPPGTIHAPITVTDCLFTGGMCMHPAGVRKTMEIWEWLCKHPRCTNEPHPRQAAAVIDYINRAVHRNPQVHGYTDEQLNDFDVVCEKISGKEFNCTCKGNCEDCSCSRVGKQCGPRCHKGRICKNPIGCRKAYTAPRE